MAGLCKLETYLLDLGVQFEEIEEHTYLINDEKKGLRQVVIAYDDPIVIIRVNVMKLPSKNRESFYENLLKLNSADLLHGAYGISGNSIVLLDTLEHDTMDRSELEASLDAIGFALVQHYAVLAAYRD